jgi:hypothetical protein
MKIFLIVLLFISCTIPLLPKKPEEPPKPKVPLEERGWSKKDRIGYMEMNNDLYPFFIRNSFIDKDLTMGLHKDLIIYLYGLPDAEQGDSVWHYIDDKQHRIFKFNSKGQLIDY